MSSFNGYVNKTMLWVPLFLLSSVDVGRAQQVAMTVYGVHDIELGEAVDVSEFERYIVEKVVPAWTEPRNGMRMAVLKGDRGERKGKYQLVYIFGSAETRDKFFPTEDGPASDLFRETMAPIAEVMQGLAKFPIERKTFTDYSPVGLYSPSMPGTTPVFAVRNVELGTDVDVQAFEQFVTEKFSPIWKEPREGFQFVITKGNRGARKGKFQFIWVFESIEIRNEYFPEEGGDGSGKLANVVASAGEIMQELREFPFTITDYSDYYPVNSLAEIAVAQSEVSWRKAEWSKLTGVWKATFANGNYRLKRITEGKEVLEHYNAQDELIRTGETEMKLDRHQGLNFFTVRIGTPREYTSIYKIHNGKWYEQLRGIFAENDEIAPDAFLIYERVED